MTQILLVEDEKSVRHLLRKVLERENYTVVEAHNGYEGIQRYQVEPTDLVITDMQMPVMDGRQLILALRRMFPGATILAISGEQRALDIASALYVQGTLQKPFAPEELLTAVQQLIRQHGA